MMTLLARTARRTHNMILIAALLLITTIVTTFAYETVSAAELAAIEAHERAATAAELTGADLSRARDFAASWHPRPVGQYRLAYVGDNRDGTKMRNAFTYDWRLWTLPELRELLLDAGFATVDVYTEGWDDDEDDTDGIFRKRKWFDNQSAWVAYVVASV